MNVNIFSKGFRVTLDLGYAVQGFRVQGMKSGSRK